MDPGRQLTSGHVQLTKGPGSRSAGIAMAFKLIESAQHRWRAVNSAHLVALLRASVRFENGVRFPNTEDSEPGDASLCAATQVQQTFR